MPRIAALALSCLAAWAVSIEPAWAHAFPDHSDPRVGATLGHPPQQIRIWFDGSLEKVFSRIRVDDAQGRQVSKGNGEVAGADDRLLETDVPSLPAGTYHVYWSVVARDGHRTMGDFSFSVQGR